MQTQRHLVIAFVAFVLALPASAGEPPLTTIAEAIVDANGDTIPDRLSQPIHVRGVVTIAADVVAPDRMQPYIQDETAGIYLFAREPDSSLRNGDVVDVTGVLAQYRGAPQIVRPVFRVTGKSALVRPASMSIRQAASWSSYGKLVQVSGRIGKWRQEGPNLSFELRSGDDSIRFVLPPKIQPALPVDSLPSGSDAEVTGVVSIYSLAPPYRSGFRLIVGDSRWVRVTRRPLPRWVWRAAIAAIAVMIAGAIAIVALAARRRRLMRRNRQVAALNALSAMAAGVTDVDAFLKEAFDVMSGNGLIDGAVVHLLDGKQLRMRTHYGVDENNARAVDEQIQAQVALSVTSRDFMIAEPTTLLGAATSLHPLVCVPLQGRTRTVGILTAFTAMRHTLTPAEAGMIAAAANLLALGIENVNMLQKAEVRERELEQLAITDPLTGLYNRRFMDEYLRIHMAMAHRQKSAVSFIVIDLDHFKAVNDAYGHDTGDRMLAEVGDLIRATTRASDLAVRLGGEEFLVVMTDTGEGGAETFAMRLRSVLNAHGFAATGVPGNFRLTASFGIAVYPDHGSTVRELLRVGDESMYESKRNGRDRITIGSGQPPMLR